jgi:hypothetical protein
MVEVANGFATSAGLIIAAEALIAAAGPLAISLTLAAAVALLLSGDEPQDKNLAKARA